MSLCIVVVPKQCKDQFILGFPPFLDYNVHISGIIKTYPRFDFQLWRTDRHTDGLCGYFKLFIKRKKNSISWTKKWKGTRAMLHQRVCARIDLVITQSSSNCFTKMPFPKDQWYLERTPLDMSYLCHSNMLSPAKIEDLIGFRKQTIFMKKILFCCVVTDAVWMLLIR